MIITPPSRGGAFLNYPVSSIMLVIMQEKTFISHLPQPESLVLPPKLPLCEYQHQICIIAISSAFSIIILIMNMVLASYLGPIRGSMQCCVYIAELSANSCGNIFVKIPAAGGDIFVFCILCFPLILSFQH